MPQSKTESYLDKFDDSTVFNPVRGSAFSVSAQVVRMLIQYGTQLILARILLPAEFGVVAMVAPVLTFVQLINDVGFGQIIVTREKLEQQQVSALFWTNLLFSTVIAAVLIVLSPLVGFLYQDYRATQLVIVLSLSVPLATLFNIPGALLARRLKFSPLALLEVGISALSGVIAIGLSLMGWSYWSIVVGQVVSASIGSVVIWHMCSWRPGRPGLSKLDMEDLATGRNLTLTNLTNFLTGSVDNIIVGVTAGAEPLGLYDRSYRLAVQPVVQLLGPVGRITIPILARASSDLSRFRRVFFFVLGCIMATTVPIFVVCIARGTDVITLLLGEKWIAAGPLFSWICVGGIVSGVYTSLIWLMISENRSRDMVMCTTTITCVSIIAFLLGALWGALGVAIASGLTFLLFSNPLMVYTATRGSRISPAVFFEFIKPFVVAASLGIAANLLVPPGENAGHLSSVVTGASLAVGALILCLIVFASGRAFVKDAAAAAKMIVAGSSL